MGAAVLVELPEIKDKTEGGIIKAPDMIIQEKQEHDGFLKVLAAGEDAKPAVGDEIIANLMQCSNINLDGTQYGYIPAHAILGYKPKK
jgi:co-chaperonin GroES (HSP10)